MDFISRFTGRGAIPGSFLPYLNPLLNPFKNLPFCAFFKLISKVAKAKQKALKTSGFKCLMLELLGGFEPPTSSLPTDWEGEVCCFPGLLCPLLSGTSCSPALLRPLVPSARFPVWVTVWVRDDTHPRSAVSPTGKAWRLFADLI